jgi:nitroreductase
VIDELIDRNTLHAALELACRAPSVHNTQPWTWELTDHSISLHADLHRWLPATDPDGRDLVVSCGAALHHLVVALASVGVRASVHRLPNPDEPDHLASVELRHGRGTDEEVVRGADVGRRCSDRRPFRAWPVPAETLAALREAAENQGALVRVLGRTGDRTRMLADARAADVAQAATPGYEGELALWSGRTADSEGVPAANLTGTSGHPHGVGRRFAAGTLQDTEHDVDGAELLVIGTSSDDRLAQLRAGEALSAVLLAATHAGLASCPLSQVLEVPTTRRALRDGVLGGSVEPQVVVRVGWASSGPELPTTPRRPLHEVLTTV